MGTEKAEEDVEVLLVSMDRKQHSRTSEMEGEGGWRTAVIGSSGEEGGLPLWEMGCRTGGTDEEAG